jgi:hypothetical protein
VKRKKKRHPGPGNVAESDPGSVEPVRASDPEVRTIAIRPTHA